MYTIGGYLCHHGILGMKWGIRRFQPYPDGSSKGTFVGDTQKKTAKKVVKAYRKEKTSWSTPYSVSDKFKKKMTESVKSILSNEEIDSIRNKKEKALDLYEKSVGAEEEYETKCQEEAYKKCYDWFEKNNPEYLNEIIKNNKGDKAGLDSFHDFDTALDGFLDEEFDKTHDQFRKEHPEVIQADKAWSEYINEAKKATSKLLGEYGNKKIKGEKLNDLVYWSTDLDEILKVKR